MRHPRITRAALEALSRPFFAAQAGGFRGDGLDELTGKQIRAAEKFLDDAGEYLDQAAESEPSL